VVVIVIEADLDHDDDQACGWAAPVPGSCQSA